MLIIFIRSILLYLLIIFCLRLMGKRMIGELQPSELVITILVSNMAALPIEDTNIPMLTGAVPIFALVGFELILSCLSLKSKRLRSIISGHPVILIRNGMIDQLKMKQLRFSIDDLMEEMRENGIFDLNEVDYAVVETNGKINFLQKFSYQNVTAEMLQLNGTSSLPLVVISDGTIICETLNTYGFNKEWVQKILKKEHYKLEEVFLMTADQAGVYQIIPKKQGI